MILLTFLTNINLKNMAKQKKEVPAPRPIVELYSKFKLLPYKNYFKVFAAKNHTATLKEIESAIEEISQTNKLEFVDDIESLNKGERVKDEDKKRLAEIRRALMEIGYEASDFYNILFETVKTDLTRDDFVNKVCNALGTRTNETNKPVKEKKHSKKSAEMPLPMKKEEKEEKEEETPYYMKAAISPKRLAQKLGMPLDKVKKILKETNPQLIIGEKGVTVSATLPWDKI